MKHEMHAHYPAPSDVVIKMFTDKDYHGRKMEKMGIEFKVLEHEFDGDNFRLKAQRSVPIQATGLAAKFMPSTTQVVNDEKWSVNNKTGSVVVETKGVPLKMSCTAKMQDEGDSCVVIYSWEIKAKIPMGGGALEKFVVADMKDREAEERDAAISLLDAYR